MTSNSVTPFIGVLLVDDQRVVRVGVRTLLQDTADIWVQGEATDGATTLAEAVAPYLTLSPPSREGTLESRN
ncbi:MAG: hypothetical protein JNN07_02720 [Verrucomicrobiales bacterium]|nr:hypothetical protein [Verrucomicrobiales bacterium]